VVGPRGTADRRGPRAGGPVPRRRGRGGNRVHGRGHRGAERRGAVLGPGQSGRRGRDPVQPARPLLERLPLGAPAAGAGPVRPADHAGPLRRDRGRRGGCRRHRRQGVAADQADHRDPRAPRVRRADHAGGAAGAARPGGPAVLRLHPERGAHPGGRGTARLRLRGALRAQDVRRRGDGGAVRAAAGAPGAGALPARRRKRRPAGGTRPGRPSPGRNAHAGRPGRGDARPGRDQRAGGRDRLHRRRRPRADRGAQPGADPAPDRTAGRAPPGDAAARRGPGRLPGRLRDRLIPRQRGPQRRHRVRAGLAGVLRAGREPLPAGRERLRRFGPGECARLQLRV